MSLLTIFFIGALTGSGAIWAYDTVQEGKSVTDELSSGGTALLERAKDLGSSISSATQTQINRFSNQADDDADIVEGEIVSDEFADSAES